MRYPKEVVLKNKKEALIRPLEKTDESMLTNFYAAIPEKDRWYLRYNVMDPATIKRWIEAIGTETAYSIVALAAEKIIAHASLHLRDFGSTRHVGRLRIMVLPEFRHQRLGTWMLLDLIQLAMDKGLNDLRADFVVGVENGAIEAAHKLDFFKSAVLKEYVKSPRGLRYDLQIMVKRLHRSYGDF